MAIGRRCDIGCETWPDKMIYATCPTCGEPTTRYSKVTPIDDAEAESILAHQQFEQFYSRRCAAAGIPVDGPLPACS